MEPRQDGRDIYLHQMRKQIQKKEIEAKDGIKRIRCLGEYFREPTAADVIVCQ